MPRTLLIQSGKREQLSLASASESGPRSSKRFFVTDRISKACFLVDSGADISAYPPSEAERRKGPTDREFFAANGSAIRSYGVKMVTLDLGLRRTFRWPFHICDVSKPILGADFFYQFGLVPDLRNRHLIDTNIGLKARGSLAPSSQPSLQLLSSSTTCDYAAIIKEFPAILDPPSADRPVKHNVVHRITTTGQPCHAKVRRLDPTKYNSAKANFEAMLNSE